MANEQNLRPITTKKRAREIGSLGGQVKSATKKHAAQLREIKKRVKSGQLLTKDQDWITARMLDPELSIRNQVDLLDAVRDSNAVEDPEMKLKLSKAYGELHTRIYGQKNFNQNVNINVNVNEDIEAAFARIQKNNIIEVEPNGEENNEKE